MEHPYKDVDYVISLLTKYRLIDGKEAKNLRVRAHIPLSKGHDLVQWIHSLGLKRHDRHTDDLDEAAVLQAISQDKGWEFKRLDPLDLDLEVVTRALPANFCKRRLVVPIKQANGMIQVAAYDPLQKDLLFDISKACKEEVSFVVAPKRDIEQIINEFFGFRESLKKAEDLLKRADRVDISNLEQFVKITSPEDASREQHINAAVDYLLKYALQERASDIHMEPKRDLGLVRLRIDGVLHTIHKIPKVVHEAMCTRIKALSRLDVAEKRRPQDGRLKISWKGSDAEVRISTVPVAFGEKIVLRIQTPEILFSELDELGMSAKDLSTFKGFLEKRHGIILVTGPTGSGKSTTLYSTLRHLNSPSINIITVEDPIEMIYEDFNQIAVQPAIGVTFSSILRNILRQDPDIIMIGEIRDQETAQYAVQAALTGHLVFSTLHTNDTVGAVTRLKDLGIEPFLIASTLVGVVAQRLVRTICRFCKEGVEMGPLKLAPLGIKIEKSTVSLWAGRGCTRCRNTGFLGRTGIYEVMPISCELQELISSNAPEEDLRRAAKKAGMTPISFDAAEKVLKGVTTVEEALSVTGLGINLLD